jgi:hypothetical protein
VDENAKTAVFQVFERSGTEHEPISVSSNMPLPLKLPDPNDMRSKALAAFVEGYIQVRKSICSSAFK